MVTVVTANTVVTVVTEVIVVTVVTVLVVCRKYLVTHCPPPHTHTHCHPCINPPKLPHSKITWARGLSLNMTSLLFVLAKKVDQVCAVRFVEAAITFRTSKMPVSDIFFPTQSEVCC
jgi:hypothetical protein